jgi:hypothetical protein
LGVFEIVAHPATSACRCVITGEINGAALTLRGKVVTVVALSADQFGDIVLYAIINVELYALTVSTDQVSSFAGSALSVGIASNAIGAAVVAAVVQDVPVVSTIETLNGIGALETPVKAPNACRGAL